MDENETFRFGNGGTQQSKQRWRLPILVGQTLVCVWVSVVEVPSLGLLLGRDFLDSIGGVLSFARKLLRADHLDGSLIRLRQLVAGHFALQLLPRRWPVPGPQGWKKLGIDSVLELQVSSGEWLNRRLQASGAFSTSSPAHEHLITEHAVLAADVANSGLELDNIPAGGTPAQDMLAVLQSTSNSTTSPPTRKTSSRTRTLFSGADASSRMEQFDSLGKNGHSSSNSRSMARARYVVMALAAIATALSAISLSGAVSSVQQWRQQAELMIRNGALSRKHVSKAERAEAFTIANLAQCRWFRDRMGWRHAFVEDPMMEGMLLARSTKGSAIRLKQQVLQDAQKEAKKAEENGEREEMVRQLLGPLGGLPSLRGDLIKLAALLHIQVDAKVTVEQLKAKIRPMVHTLKGGDSPKAQGTTMPSQASPGRTKTPKSTPSSPEVGQVALMRQMMEQQDARFKSILDQALQRVMNAQQLGEGLMSDPYPNQPMADVSPGFTGATLMMAPGLREVPIHTPLEPNQVPLENPNLEDQIDWDQINAEERRALYEDRMMAVHGPNEEDWGSDFSGKS